MLSTKRIRCGSFCMITEPVRMPSPKKRTPRISVPSVTPVAAKMTTLARREVPRPVDLLEIGDAHRAAPFLVLRLADDEAREDFAVEAAHGGRGQNAFGRAADTHHGVHAGTDDCGGNAGGKIAVAYQPDPCASGADVVNQLLVARPIQHDDHEVLDLTAQAASDRLQVVGRRRVEVDRILGARSDHELLHVKVRSVQQPALVGRRQDGNGIWRTSGAQVGAFKGIDRDIHFREATGPPVPVDRMSHADLFADVQHRGFVALTFADDDCAVDRHTVHYPPHRLHSDLIGLVAVALPHRMRAGDRRLFDDPEEFQRKI